MKSIAWLTFSYLWTILKLHFWIWLLGLGFLCLLLVELDLHFGIFMSLLFSNFLNNFELFILFQFLSQFDKQISTSLQSYIVIFRQFYFLDSFLNNFNKIYQRKLLYKFCLIDTIQKHSPVTIVITFLFRLWREWLKLI